MVGWINRIENGVVALRLWVGDALHILCTVKRTDLTIFLLLSLGNGSRISVETVFPLLVCLEISLQHQFRYSVTTELQLEQNCTNFVRCLESSWEGIYSKRFQEYVQKVNASIWTCISESTKLFYKIIQRVTVKIWTSWITEALPSTWQNKNS